MPSKSLSRLCKAAPDDHYSNPSPEIFHLALEKLQANPSESVFIDDNIRHVDAAAKIGIHAIQFKSAEQLKADLAELHINI